MFSKYNSIGHFDSKIHELRKMYGVNLGTVDALATEKIHGTNAAICLRIKDGEELFEVQKRTSNCTPENDNAGCAAAAYENKEAWVQVVKKIASLNDINLEEEALIVYYEWAGGNIQQKTCVTGLEKSAFIFAAAKAVRLDESEQERWVTTWGMCNPSAKIYNVLMYPTWKLELDLSNPQATYEEMTALVLRLEDDSPMGNAFGFEGNTMEGIVVEFRYKDKIHRFKVKGEKHSKTIKKVRPNPFDDDVMKEINDLAEKLTPVWRLEQGADEVGNTTKDIGALIKWVQADVIKEEVATLEGMDELKKKRVLGLINKICARYIKDNIL